MPKWDCLVQIREEAAFLGPQPWESCYRWTPTPDAGDRELWMRVMTSSCDREADATTLVTSALPLIAKVSDTASGSPPFTLWSPREPTLASKEPRPRGLPVNGDWAVAARGPKSIRSGWPRVIRTWLIPDRVAASLPARCDGVLNRTVRLDMRSVVWVGVVLDGCLARRARTCSS
jgi:hypothetical protein